MRLYRLELETVLSLLEEARQNGMLTAILPPGTLKQKISYQVKIVLVEGKAVSCYIEDGSGRTPGAETDKIPSFLYGLGAQDWYFDTQIDTSFFQKFPSPSQPVGAITQKLPLLQPNSSIRNLGSLIPQIAVSIDPMTLQSLTRRQRRILGLIDGSRDVARIAAILFPSTQNRREVLEILSELERMNLIYFK